MSSSKHVPTADQGQIIAPGLVVITGEFYTIKQAAEECGWKRANTFREWFLATEEDATEMGLRYDEQGRALVEVAAVKRAARIVAKERSERDPNWRIKNLKGHARRRRATPPDAGAR